MPCDNPSSSCSGEDPPTIALLYMVEAGRHDVVVVIDPDNIIGVSYTHLTLPTILLV